MRRFADLFIAICIPLVAASAGAIAYWQFDASGRLALVQAAAVLIVLAAARIGSVTRRRRRIEEDRLVVLGHRLTRIAGGIEALERRVSALEAGGVGAAAATAPEELDQVVAEVEVLGTLTRQIIETVADLEVQFTELRSSAAHAAAPAAEERTAIAPAARAIPAARAALVPEPFGHLDEDDFLTVVLRAARDDRIDLHLQPIVSLPQRKVRFYEILARLRGDDGEPIHPSDYIPVAESHGAMAEIDRRILVKALAIVRRLAERTQDVGVFLNLSAASLGNAEFFRNTAVLLEENRDLAEVLVFEFAQSSVRAMGPIEQEGLRAFQTLGFRFSIDQIVDLKTSFQNLADRGFRHAKISAERLLHRADELGTDIHPADLTDYFRRFGMELVADHLEREADVIDVLDYGVRFGQGIVFAPPRPVRLEAAPRAVRAEESARSDEPPRSGRPDEARTRPAAAIAAAPAPAPASAAVAAPARPAASATSTRATEAASRTGAVRGGAANGMASAGGARRSAGEATVREAAAATAPAVEARQRGAANGSTTRGGGPKPPERRASTEVEPPRPGIRILPGTGSR